MQRGRYADVKPRVSQSGPLRSRGSFWVPRTNPTLLTACGARQFDASGAELEVTAICCVSTMKSLFIFRAAQTHLRQRQALDGAFEGLLSSSL